MCALGAFVLEDNEQLNLFPHTQFHLPTHTNTETKTQTDYNNQLVNLLVAPRVFYMYLLLLNGVSGTKREKKHKHKHTHTRIHVTIYV